MKHSWQRRTVQICCDWWCPQCNDCKCQGKGWKKYNVSACPNFDTQAGKLRPPRTDRSR